MLYFELYIQNIEAYLSTFISSSKIFIKKIIKEKDLNFRKGGVLDLEFYMVNT